MTQKSVLSWAVRGALLVSSFGCSAHLGSESEESAQQSAALQNTNAPSCSIPPPFVSDCAARGGTAICEQTTPMCCKTTKDENGNDSTFCSSNPNDVEIQPTPPPSRTAPIRPGLGFHR